LVGNKQESTADAHLFLTRTGTPLTTNGLYQMLRQIGSNMLGLTHFGPHILRDIFVSHIGELVDGDRMKLADIAAAMLTSVDVLLGHYVHLRDCTTATRAQEVVYSALGPAVMDEDSNTPTSLTSVIAAIGVKPTAHVASADHLRMTQGN
jgi:hypothetical protein